MSSIDLSFFFFFFFFFFAVAEQIIKSVIASVANINMNFSKKLMHGDPRRNFFPTIYLLEVSQREKLKEI
jgi:hypothetical protein